VILDFFADFRQFFVESCPPKAMKALFDTPHTPPDFIKNAFYDTLDDL
jgi:hypothetical protein